MTIEEIIKEAVKLKVANLEYSAALIATDKYQQADPINLSVYCGEVGEAIKLIKKGDLR